MTPVSRRQFLAAAGTTAATALVAPRAGSAAPADDAIQACLLYTSPSPRDS